MFVVYRKRRSILQEELVYATCIEESYTKFIEKENEFPDHIRNATNNIKKKIRLKNLKFKGGLTNDLNRFYRENPNHLNNYCGQLPSYVVQFTWKELSLGIGKYEIYMVFDSFGQLIQLNYPLYFFSEKFKFNSLDYAFQKADSLIILESMKYDEPLIELEYIESEKDLIWTFEYGTVASEENILKKVYVNLTSKNYKVVQLDQIEYELKDDIEVEEEIIELKNIKP